MTDSEPDKKSFLVALKEMKRAITVTTKQLEGTKLESPQPENAVQTYQQQTSLIFESVARGKPIGSIENLERLLDFRGIVLRYNIISKTYETIIPDVYEFSPENAAIASRAYLLSEMTKAGLPTEHLREYMAAISDKNRYNPVQEWIKSRQWDGVERIQELCNTITAKNKEAKDLFIRRWLIMAVAHACERQGTDSSCCLVLQGKQDLGKTWWFRKLCPLPGMVRTGVSFDAKDRDSLSQLIRYWIVEFGEIGSTYSRSGIDALKAFITNPHDILRRPYAENDQTYARRTVLGASVNESIYLHDTTGNRRFMTVECTFVNSYHEIDMQQLWAEVYDIYCQGESWQLSGREKQLIDEINSEHIQIEPIEEEILQAYDWTSSFTRSWKTATQIAKDIGIRYPTQRETRVITTFVRKMNNNEEQYEKRTKDGRLLLMPDRKS